MKKITGFLVLIISLLCLASCEKEEIKINTDEKYKIEECEILQSVYGDYIVLVKSNCEFFNLKLYENGEVKYSFQNIRSGASIGYIQAIKSVDDQTPLVYTYEIEGSDQKTKIFKGTFNPDYLYIGRMGGFGYSQYAEFLQYDSKGELLPEADWIKQSDGSLGKILYTTGIKFIGSKGTFDEKIGKYKICIDFETISGCIVNHKQNIVEYPVKNIKNGEIELTIKDLLKIEEMIYQYFHNLEDKEIIESGNPNNYKIIWRLATDFPDTCIRNSTSGDILIPPFYLLKMDNDGYFLEEHLSFNRYFKGETIPYRLDLPERFDYMKEYCIDILITN